MHAVWINKFPVYLYKEFEYYVTNLNFKVNYLKLVPIMNL